MRFCSTAFICIICLLVYSSDMAEPDKGLAEFKRYALIMLVVLNMMALSSVIRGMAT